MEVFYLIKEIDVNNFRNEVLIPNTPVVVDFWAPWCCPCKMLTPVLDKLSNELSNKVKFVKVNIDSNPLIAQSFNISSIPTLLIFKNGQLEKNLVGFVPKSKLQKILNKLYR